MFLPIVGPVARIVLRTLTFILYAVTIVAAYGGHVNPALTALPGVLTMAFPYLAIASMIVTAIWFVCGKWITGAIGVAALAACWSPLTNAVPFHFSRNPKADKVQFSVMTWNWLHGNDQNAKPGEQVGAEPVDFIINSGADIVCLQEMVNWNSYEIPNLTDSVKEAVTRAYPYVAYPPDPRNADRDTRVLSKYPVRYITTDEWRRRYPGTVPDDLRVYHFGLYEVNVEGNMVLLVNVHLFSAGLSPKQREVMTDIHSVGSAKASAREFKNSILHKLKRNMLEHERDVNLLCGMLSAYRGPIVICGDFNDVPESYALRKMAQAGFNSVQAEVGFGPLITYNQHLMWFQLDHVFYRGALRPLSIKKQRIRTSDHYPLKVAFELE